MQERKEQENEYEQEEKDVEARVLAGAPPT